MESSKKDFMILTAKDVRSLLEEKNYAEDEFKLKPLSKRNENLFMLTPKGYKHYSELSDSLIVGNIRYWQKHYCDYSLYEYLKKEKRKRNIIGQLRLSGENDDIIKYDVRKPRNKHTVGYCWVGGNQFVRIVSFNPFLLLIPLILAGIIAFLFSSCPKEDTVLPWADQSEIIDSKGNEETTQAPLCYFVPYPKQITLTENNKTIPLRNVAENEGNYYISYEIYVDNKHIKIRDIQKDEDPNNAYITGLIKPGDPYNIDLWSKLDAGTYKLVCRATEYGYKDKDKKDITYDLTTTLVVEK